jgi:ribosomal protein L28
MIKKLLCGLAILGLCAYSQAEPLDRIPRVQRLVDTVIPEEFEATIYLTGGRTVVVERVGLSPESLQRRFTMNSLDKTVRVRPKGEVNRITLNVSEIEKIEIKRVKNVKPEPTVQP